MNPATREDIALSEATEGRRTVIVTGGGTGMGRAIAADFAGRGECVVILGRREEVLARTAEELQNAAPGGQVLWRRCDVGEAGDVEAFRAWLLAHRMRARFRRCRHIAAL